MEMELSLQKSWLTFGLILTLGLINVLLIKQNLHLVQEHLI